MSQEYCIPSRESDPFALPDLEVFYVSKMEALYNQENADHADENTLNESGWYYWFCFPGCLPDSDPYGPFTSKKKALQDARQYNEE
jgi:hypothetical protein